jgi:hypothetical protein
MGESIAIKEYLGVGEVQNEMHAFQKWGGLLAVARKPLGPGEPERAFWGG